MPAFQVKQEHQRNSNIVASLPGVPSHPSQLAQHTGHAQHLNGHLRSSSSRASTSKSSQSSSQGPQSQQNSTMATAPSMYPLDENQIDVTSQKGIFGWAVIDRTNVPYIIREKKRFVSVRMVEMKLLSKYPSTYPEELKDRPPLMSQYITPSECKLLNEINFDHCAGEFGTNEFTPKDLIVSLEDFEDFYNIVKKHFPEDALQSLAKAKKTSGVDGGWVQVNNTVVPYVVRVNVKLVPLSVIRYAAGLLSDVKVHGIEPFDDECNYLNSSCKSAGLEFNFAKSTKMIELKLIPNLSDTKVSVVELPKNDPFGHAEYQELPEESSPAPQMGATLPVNMPVGPQPGVPFLPHGMGMPPGPVPGQAQRGMLPPRMPFDGVPPGPHPPVGPDGAPAPIWMNPHMGVFPGFQGRLPGQHMVPGPPRPMGPRSFTATQSSPAGTLPPGYGSPDGAMQPPNQHALQNLQHMAQMAEMQAARGSKRHSMDGRPSSRGSSGRSHTPDMIQGRRSSSSGGSAHVSPPQHQLPKSQLSPRLPMGPAHSPGAMMEGMMNGMPPRPGMMMMPPGHHPGHPAMMRIPGHPGPLPWQMMSRNPAEFQEMMRHMPPEMLAGMNPAALPHHRPGIPRSHPSAIHVPLPHLDMEKAVKSASGGLHKQISPRERQSSPLSRSPAMPKEKSPPVPSILPAARERGRVKSIPTRISPSAVERAESPTGTSPVKPPTRVSIKPVEFHKKTISCLVKGKECYALVEAISRVYFPYCSLEDFQFALEKVLHIRICQLNREEEEMFIKFYGLPTKSLRCNKCVHLRDFDEFMPQIKYMFKDKEPVRSANDTLVDKRSSASKPNGDSNNNAKSSSESNTSGANSRTFQALRNFLGKRGADGTPAGAPPSKAARGFASRLEDAVNRLKKQKQLKSSGPGSPPAAQGTAEPAEPTETCAPEKEISEMAGSKFEPVKAPVSSGPEASVEGAALENDVTFECPAGHEPEPMEVEQSDLPTATSSESKEIIEKGQQEMLANENLAGPEPETGRTAAAETTPLADPPNAETDSVDAEIHSVEAKSLPPMVVKETNEESLNETKEVQYKIPPEVKEKELESAMPQNPDVEQTTYTQTDNKNESEASQLVQPEAATLPADGKTENNVSTNDGRSFAAAKDDDLIKTREEVPVPEPSDTEGGNTQTPIEEEENCTARESHDAACKKVAEMTGDEPEMVTMSEIQTETCQDEPHLNQQAENDSGYIETTNEVPSVSDESKNEGKLDAAANELELTTHQTEERSAEPIKSKCTEHIDSNQTNTEDNSLSNQAVTMLNTDEISSIRESDCEKVPGDVSSDGDEKNITDYGDEMLKLEIKSKEDVEVGREEILPPPVLDTVPEVQPAAQRPAQASDEKMDDTQRDYKDAGLFTNGDDLAEPTLLVSGCQSGALENGNTDNTDSDNPAEILDLELVKDDAGEDASVAQNNNGTEVPDESQVADAPKSSAQKAIVVSDDPVDNFDICFK